MIKAHTIEKFCDRCGANVRLAYVELTGGLIAAKQPCELTSGGTVYRRCPMCGCTVPNRPGLCAGDNRWTALDEASVTAADSPVG